jgi:hypothetical protein
MDGTNGAAAWQDWLVVCGYLGFTLVIIWRVLGQDKTRS